MKDKILELLDCIDTTIVRPIASFEEEKEVINGLTGSIREELKTYMDYSDLIGKQVYIIDTYRDCRGKHHDIIIYQVSTIIVDKAGAYLPVSREWNVRIDKLNKIWFMSREEAERKIEEMKAELILKLKIDLINSMEVIEHSASCGEIEYVLVEDNPINREILYKLGMNDEDIKIECYPDDGHIDISPIGFKYANWYSGKTKRFSIDKPINEEE